MPKKNIQNNVAIFGGGCFWCTEAVFKMLKGVSVVLPGYAGGIVPKPTYEQVSGGGTGHAEVVYIEFNPQEVSYRTLLTVFFGSHDPTSVNRQGNDIGTQYRSVIFYTTPEQKKDAVEFIKEINDSNKEGKPVATDVEPLDKFYEAENYHKDYFAKNPGNPYCEIVINPKLEKVKEYFAELLMSSGGGSASGGKKIPTNEQEWRENLTPEQYKILREKGTEAPFSGKLLHADKDGTYMCSACGNPLFSSDAKFESGTGWPSFDEAIVGSVKQIPDNAHGSSRTEIVCSRCGSHLGHVFNDGPTKTGKRFCLNSVCLDLEEGTIK